MLRVWVFFLGMAGALWAVEDDRRFTCPDKMLEMTEAVLGAKAGIFHLATDVVHQLSRRPAFRSRFQSLLALHDLVRSDAALANGLAGKLADPVYSDRGLLARDCLGEIGKGIPTIAQDYLVAALATFPVARDPQDPKTQERNRLETEAVLASVTDSELVSLYQTWKLDDDSPSLVKGRVFLKVKTIDEFKQVIRLKRQAPLIYLNYRDQLLLYARTKVEKFANRIQKRGLSAKANDEAFETHLIEVHATANSRPLFHRLLHACNAATPQWSATEIQSKISAWILAALAELRHELLLVQRQECESSSVAASPGGKPDAPFDLQCVSRKAPGQRPSRTRRRLAQDQNGAEAARFATAPLPAIAPPLDEEQIEALFSRMSPTETHYSKFLRALEDARRKLTAKQFLKLRGHIVGALRNLEAGVPPVQAGGLTRADRGVWEQRPLGTSTTHRFFIGQIGGDYFILCLSYDVKSGIDKEKKLIVGLEQEVRKMESDWRES